MDLNERPPGDDVRRHPWEIARARSFRLLIASHVDVPDARRVLDIGAGDGWFATDIRARAPAGGARSCAGTSTTARRISSRRPGRASCAPPSRRTDRSTSCSPSTCWSTSSRTSRSSPTRSCRRWLLARWRCSACRRTRGCSPTTIGCSNTPAGTGRRRSATWSPVTSTSWRPARCSPRSSRCGRSTWPASGSAGPASSRGVGAWQAGRVVTGAATAVLAADAALGRWTAAIGLPMPGLSTWVVARRS